MLLTSRSVGRSTQILKMRYLLIYRTNVLLTNRLVEESTYKHNPRYLLIYRTNMQQLSWVIYLDKEHEVSASIQYALAIVTSLLEESTQK